MKKLSNVSLVVLSIIFVLYTGYVSIFVTSEDQNITLFIPSAILLIAISSLIARIFIHKSSIREINKLKKQLQYKNELVESIKNNNKNCLEWLPVGVIIYSDEKVITYANKFAEDFFKVNSLFGKSLDCLQDSFCNELKNKETFDYSLFDRSVNVTVKRDNRLIYLLDSTKKINAINDLNNIRPTLLYLEFDNIDLISILELKERTELLSKYYKIIEDWKNKFNLFQLSSTQNQLIFMLNNKSLEDVKKDQFSILRNIDDLSKETMYSISVSIGIGTASDDYSTLGLYADKALDFAKDRGGAQAVIYDGDSFMSYQGNGLSFEKKSRVSSRIYANKLVELIKNSSSLVIMPHIDTDADGFASACLLALLCEYYKTPAKILIDKNRIDSTVNKFLVSSSKEYIALNDFLITESELDPLLKNKPLLVLLDHHEQKLSPSKKVYEIIKQITVIDHHRLSNELEFIPIIEHIDHNASSTVELVSELIDLLSVDLEIPSFISTMSLVGMIIDTNDFRVHTTDITFKVASFLMQKDADTVKAKMFLRETIEEKTKRVNLLKNAEIIDKRYSLLKMDQDSSKEEIAKAAEALLDTEGIVASFVIARIDKNTIGVSSRSNGDFNCHIEMEKLGGGGHYNGGAAQLENRNIDDVYQELLLNLKSTLEGGSNNMKVILIEDVKKQGKKGDIIEVTPGYANFLLSKKFAVEANADNLATLSLEKQAKADRDKEELEVAIKTKEIIENNKITLKVKLGETGKFFGSVSTKQVADELLKELKIDIDKRKINLPATKIEEIGTYEFQIKLHKDVVATLKVDIIEG